MKILYAASEANPFAKSGGLADVAGALPKALVKDGVAIPGATASAAAAAGAPTVLSFPALVRQACCAAGSALTLVLTGAAATVNNVALRVQRI